MSKPLYTKTLPSMPTARGASRAVSGLLKLLLREPPPCSGFFLRYQHRDLVPDVRPELISTNFGHCVTPNVGLNSPLGVWPGRKKPDTGTASGSKRNLLWRWRVERSPRHSCGTGALLRVAHRAKSRARLKHLRCRVDVRDERRGHVRPLGKAQRRAAVDRSARTPGWASRRLPTRHPFRKNLSELAGKRANAGH